jgi:hypothetical protein
MMAIIDGDVLAYQACNGVFQRYMTEHGLLGERGKTVLLGQDGERARIELSKEEETRYMRVAWKSFVNSIDELTGRFFCSDFLCAVKGEGNFRDVLYDKYKANRKSSLSLSSIFVPTLRRLAVHEGLAVPADGREADDLIRIWSRQTPVDEYIVFSVDKDLRCIPGKHVNLMKRGLDGAEYYTSLFIEEVSEFEAMLSHYSQILKGDPTDNIPGIPRIGDVKAAKMLSDCKTEEDMQEVVVGAYIAHYKDAWYEHMLINRKLVYLQSRIDDYASVKDWKVIKELF